VTEEDLGCREEEGEDGLLFLLAGDSSLDAVAAEDDAASSAEPFSLPTTSFAPREAVEEGSIDGDADGARLFDGDNDLT